MPIRLVSDAPADVWSHASILLKTNNVWNYQKKKKQRMFGNNVTKLTSFSVSALLFLALSPLPRRLEPRLQHWRLVCLRHLYWYNTNLSKVQRKVFMCVWSYCEFSSSMMWFVDLYSGRNRVCRVQSMMSTSSDNISSISSSKSDMCNSTWWKLSSISPSPRVKFTSNLKKSIC